METLLQLVLAELAIALSVFSLITYLWLGLTVLLIGDRRSLVTWVGGLGLLLGALFFLTHGALVGAGVPTSSSPVDFWWHLSWVPAFAAPLFWAATGLHYAGLAGVLRRLRLPALLAVAGLGALAALLALLSWRDIAAYGDFVRLVDVSLHDAAPTAAIPASPALPLLGVCFVVYVAACALLPWLSLVARGLLPPPARAGEGARADSRSDAALLWDAGDAWSRARPALLLASVLMMGAGAVVALVGVLVALAPRGKAALPPLPVVPRTLPGHVPLALVVADLCVQLALAGVGLTIGWAVVRQGVLVERRLPQRGYFSHWRAMAVLAGILGCAVAAMSGFVPEALPDFLLLVALVAGAYAAVTWQSYVSHDRFLAQLRPFVASLSVGHAGWLATDPDAVERSIEALFTSLCRDVLGASHGQLTLSAGRQHRALVYAAADAEPDTLRDAREWVLPVRDERGVVARLVLGPRADGAGYTSADLEIARACGERILDAVGEFATAQAVASLARRRGLEAELSAALPRRVLHDEVLPRLHLSMLRLEALRARVARAVAVPAGGAGAADAALPAGGTASVEDLPALPAELGGVVSELARAHHDLAALMRATPMANTRRLEHGLVGALRGALDGEFRGTFDVLEWEAADSACAAADALPSIVADLLLGATLEAVRNAGRHARGDDLHRRLALAVSLAADAREVTVRVRDDGVGLGGGAPSPSASGSMLAPAAGGTQGTRTGLLTHGALLALVGGQLSVQSQPGSGTTVTVRVPRSGAGAHEGD